MTLGKLALVLIFGGIAAAMIGFFGAMMEAGIEWRHQSALGTVLMAIAITGFFAVPVGAILGVVRLIRGKPRPDPPDFLL